MANQTKYFKTPFAESGTRAEVPNNSVGGAVGFDTGFGPDYELPQGSAGRKRIERDKYNGLHHSITKNLKQWQENIYPTWIEDDGTGSAFEYSQGMIVDHAGQDWVSNEAANQEEPGTGTKWDKFNPNKKVRIQTTVAEIATDVFNDGDLLELSDRGNAPFKVVSGGVADGYSVLNAGAGKTAIIDEISPIIYAFGAKGNWNAQTQIGDDDSLAFQAFINYMAEKPSKRKGGIRAIFLGDGQFKISSVTLTQAFEFGIDIFGNGRDATVIWSDPVDTNPTITGEIEFVTFRNMTCFGSLSESGNSTVRKGCFYRGKLPGGRADIDVKFVNCHCGYATNFVEAYGRGVTFEGGAAVYCDSLLNIVCSEDTIFSGSTNDSVQTGMRNYSFNLRTDVTSRLLKITGSAPQKDYINGVLIGGCQFTSMDRLIDSSDARLINPLIANNQSADSFSGGVVTVSSIVGGQDLGNSWKKSYNNDANPAGSSDSIDWLYITTGSIEGLTISGTLARGLRSGVVSAGAASNNVKIVCNQFPNAFTTSGNANRFVFFSAFNCDGLTIDDNSFTSSSVAYSYRLFDSSAQTSKITTIGVNHAPWKWVDSRLSYTPKLLVNGVQTSVPPTAQGRYYLDASYVYVDAEVIVDPDEVSGNLSISIPSITAIAEAPTITSSYSGGGSVNRISGLSKSGYSIAPIQVNPVTQEAELYVEQNLIQSRLTAADSSGTVVIFVSFKYRYQ